MCLIAFAWRQHAAAPLLLTANRDEFHARPSSPLAWWSDRPGVLAGRDLQAGGTWLGLGRDGRFAAITNIRDPDGAAADAARSRGELTVDFLAGDDDPAGYLRRIQGRAGDYRGFNLLVGDRRALWYLHGGSGGEARELVPGIYGLSNAALDVPWPKVCLARERLAAAVSGGAAIPGHDALAACVADRRLADEAALHGQGLSGDMARRLSAQFIVTPTYGTRCRTTLRCHANGQRDICEERFASDGSSLGQSCFTVEAAAR